MKAAVTVAAVLIVLSVLALRAQDPLTSARDLYASAAYEEALSTLDKLGDGLPHSLDRQANEYRAFCLFALGRTNEATTVIESMVHEDPLTPLTAPDASPRLEQMFAQVRQRLLPTLIRGRFKAARTAIDQKDYATAEPQLIEALQLITEATKHDIGDETLNDLSVLVDGFLQLIQTTKSTRRAVTEAAAPAPTSAAAATPPSSPPIVAPPPAEPRVYTVADEGVTPPVVIDERHPLLTQEMKAIIKAWQMRGVLSVTIDETGRVADATLRPSLNASFDAAILGTVRQWKYVPAKKDGVPVRYLKMVALVP